MLPSREKKVNTLGHYRESEATTSNEQKYLHLTTGNFWLTKENQVRNS